MCLEGRLAHAPLPPSPPLPTSDRPQNAEWVLATSDYGGEFVAAVQRGAVAATQFHPEKSGAAGLDVLRGFLEPEAAEAEAAARRAARAGDTPGEPDQLLGCLARHECGHAFASAARPPCHSIPLLPQSHSLPI